MPHPSPFRALLMSALLPLSVAFAEDLSWLDAYDITWTSPSKNSSESMPCGGGDIGANVWVEGDALLLYADRSGNIDENDQQLKSGRLRVRLEPSPFTNTDGSAARVFRQRLNLAEGCIEIHAESDRASADLRVWAGIDQPVLNVEGATDRPATLRVSYESWRRQRALVPRTLEADGKPSSWDFNRWAMFGYFWYDGEVYTYPDTVSPSANTVEFYHRNGDDLIFDKEIKLMRIDPARHPLAHPTRARQFGGILSGDSLVNDGTSDGVYCNVPFSAHTLRSEKPTTRHHARIVFHTTQDQSVETWRKGAAKLLSEVSTPAYVAASRATTLAWWRDFWSRSRVVINTGRGPDDAGWQVGRNYNLMRFQLALNSRGEWPTRFNGGLLTFDPGSVDPGSAKINPAFFNPDFRYWGAWTAQNQRLLYWPLLKTGDFEAMRPQFEFYRKNLPNAVARTRSAWGIEGASFCEQIGTGGLPLGSHYGWEPPFGNRSPDKEVGLSNAHATYYTSALEFAYMIHEWHRFGGGDLAPYLDFLRQVVDFHFNYFGMLERRRTGSEWGPDGKLVLDPSHALESYHGRNSTDVICALRYNLQCLLALPDTQLGAAERARYSDWLGRLPEINYRTREGHRTIAPIAGEGHPPGNLELPQLYPTFPWPMFTVGKPDLQIAIDTWRYGHDAWTQSYLAPKGSYPARDEWFGWTQQAIFLARMGLADEARTYLVKKLSDARGGNVFETDTRMRFPSFWGPGFDWTPDHNWGGSGMIALQEMLLQSTDERLFILPAWPKDWDVDFKLHAPGRTVVECSYRAGRIERLETLPRSRASNLVSPFATAPSVKSDAPAALPPSDLDFTRLIPAPVPRDAIYREPGYHLWDPSVIRGDDGLYHLYYSRWKSSLGYDSWCTHAEIAWATAPAPEGPYTFRGIALPARGADFWDGHSVFNTNVVRIGSRYYLYYTGNRGTAKWSLDRSIKPYSEEWWTHRNHQRIGVATADSPSGPWTRLDHPLLDTGPAFGNTIINVPNLVFKPGGGYRLYYKTLADGPGRFGGGVFHYGADSDSPLGPFTRHPTPLVNKNELMPEVKTRFDFHIDDHFEWFQGDRYYAIVKDHDAPYLTPHGKSLLLFESPDGRAWLPSRHTLVTGFALRWNDGTRQTFQRLEMPKLLLADGKPRLLSLAALASSGGESFIVNLPLAQQQPATSP